MTNSIKISSSISYNQSLISPKGFMFDIGKVKSSNIFDQDQIKNMTFTRQLNHPDSNQCVVLHWNELHTNISGDIPDEIWTEWLESCLVATE